MVQLYEKGSISYVDLMKNLGITNTGKMNYHLKVLGDLVEKNEDAKYRLTEKGQLASRVLTEISNKSPVEQTYKWKRLIASILAIANAISLVVSSLLFFVGYIDWHFFSSQIIYSLVAFLVAFIIFKFPTSRPKYDPKRARKLTAISFVIGGAMFTSIFLFFAIGVLLMTILGTKIPGGPIGTAFLLFTFLAGPIIGGSIGYLLFKRSKYSNPSFYSPF